MWGRNGLAGRVDKGPVLMLGLHCCRRLHGTFAQSASGMDCECHHLHADGRTRVVLVFLQAED